MANGTASAVGKTLFDVFDRTLDFFARKDEQDFKIDLARALGPQAALYSLAPLQSNIGANTQGVVGFTPLPGTPYLPPGYTPISATAAPNGVIDPIWLIVGGVALVVVVAAMAR
jgi:hypothetical protein